MKARLEAWGAWVRLDNPPALVALHHDGVRALALHEHPATLPERPGPSAPLEAHVAVTARCGAGCQDCYLDAKPDGDEVSFGKLLATLDALAQAGVFTVAFGGGEPTTRADLDLLAREAKARGLTTVVTTSGLGLGPAKLQRLLAFDQVNVSFDGNGDTYAQMRGFDGSDSARDAIEALAKAGVRVGINVVLTQSTWTNLDGTLRLAKSLGAQEAQLLRYKPAGRGARLDYLARRLTPAQAATLGPRLRHLAEELSKGCPFSLRIDCALVPFLVADAALTEAPHRLAAFGILGCEAGNALVGVTKDSRLAPCSVSPPAAGSTEAWDTAWAHDSTLNAYRHYADNPPEPCASCTFRSVCKGGCKVVSAFLAEAQTQGLGETTASAFASALKPDPECPRVMAWANASHPSSHHRTSSP